LILDPAGPAPAAEALRQVRSEAGYDGPAVVCVPPGARPTSDPTGRTAWLTKPFKPAELLDAALTLVRRTPRTWRPPAPPPPPPADGPGLRVLLAEDNPINRAVAVGLLEAGGHSVRTAADGRAAVAAWAAEPFDLVLMDLQMPEL